MDGQNLFCYLMRFQPMLRVFPRAKAGLDIIAQEHAKGLAEGKKRFRYWSAASSTGEEAYSLGMLLAEAGITPM